MNTKNKDLFGNEIEIKLPITRDELTKHLYNNLSDLRLDEFVALITNRFEEIIEYAKLMQGENTCQKTSLLFNPHRLSIKAKSSARSIFDAIKELRFVSGLARATLFKLNKVNDLLYQVIQLGINGVQYINEFPPHTARNLCQKYGLKPNDRVIDPCGGWGGRMIGISVISNYYECYEPSTRTAYGLNKLYEFICSLNPDFKAIINDIPFEDSMLTPESFDFALTSPPYYDTEEYCNEETNSLNRYQTFDKWADCFYLPLIEKTMQSLKPEKTFVLNIGSRIYPLNEILIRNFKARYKINKVGNYLSGNSGLGKSGEGEMFYSIVK